LFLRTRVHLAVMTFTFLAEDNLMNALTKTTKPIEDSGEIELYHRVLNNLVQVKNGGNCVIVRLMRDNFSVPARTSFIKHLALEGFIPDRYQ